MHCVAVGAAHQAPRARDNTLPVYVYTYGEDFAPASILHGFILTVAAPFLVSAALGI